MFTIYICPDCRCEHDEPADAGYFLEARCFDCTHLMAIAELRALVTFVAPTLATRGAPTRRTVSESPTIARGRDAA